MKGGVVSVTSSLNIICFGCVSEHPRSKLVSCAVLGIPQQLCVCVCVLACGRDGRDVGLHVSTRS